MDYDRAVVSREAEVERIGVVLCLRVVNEVAIVLRLQLVLMHHVLLSSYVLGL